MTNPLVSDRDVAFILEHTIDLDRLLELPYFEDHSRETVTLYLENARRLAREVLAPGYKVTDEEAPNLVDGKLPLHPEMHKAIDALVELGVVTATRPYDLGGAQLPAAIAVLAESYLMAGNLSATAGVGLTTGAARLIETFGSEELKRKFMDRMYSCEWTGTMALTEPQAGSSLTDVETVAKPTDDGHYLIRGSKVFISGGDHDVRDNIVHLTLARIEGAPAGIKGVSLFAIPKRREEGGGLVDNDCTTAGVFHKLGWRGLPSIALNFGENEDCHGWLVGEPHRGIKYMFQMMNEARLMVGVSAMATASVAYQQSLVYANERPQGRRLGDKDPSKPQIPIVEHAQVRQLLLRQKAIVEGGMALVAKTAYFADLSEHLADETERREAFLLLDLLTPIAKSFPAERGFESNTLAIQVHGGYGYTSEYLPELFWRDQKLNSLHEGTTQIQGLDLLGRKVVQDAGNALRLFAGLVETSVAKAREAGVEGAWCDNVATAMGEIVELTMQLGAKGMSGDLDGMLLHSANYLEAFSNLVVGWVWLEQATAAKPKAGSGDGFYEGKLRAAQYWLTSELPKNTLLVRLAKDAESSFAQMQSDWF
ncbi:MAG: acyl-CoA dehydrogenase [Deltaproteobacteria bacterium]